MSGEIEWCIGDVVRYNPERADRHCREGVARAMNGVGRVILVDTFWGSMSDAHVLTATEAATASLQFNVGDYDELQRRDGYQWKNYAPADRARITSQHGLQERLFIRKGATEDHATKVENAREKLAEAQRDLDSANRAVQWAMNDLARLRTEHRSGEQHGE